MRIGFEVYLEVLFGCIYYLSNIHSGGWLEVYSIIVTIVWLILLIILIGVVLSSFKFLKREYTSNNASKLKFQILVEDLKQHKRIYVITHLIFLIQRTIFAFLLIFLWNRGLVQIILVAILFIGVFIFKIIVRPYKNVAMNIQEILIEGHIAAV